MCHEWPPPAAVGDGDHYHHDDDGMSQNHFIFQSMKKVLDWSDKDWDAAACARQVKEAYDIHHGIITHPHDRVNPQSSMEASPTSNFSIKKGYEQKKHPLFEETNGNTSTSNQKIEPNANKNKLRDFKARNTFTGISEERPRIGNDWC